MKDDLVYIAHIRDAAVLLGDELGGRMIDSGSASTSPLAWNGDSTLVMPH